MIGVWISSRVVIVATFCVALSCTQKPDESGSTHMPKPMSVGEADRARQACDEYVAVLCAKAETDGSLLEDCRLAKALPEALALSLSAAANPDSKLSPLDQKGVIANARKITAECFEELAQLQ